MAIGTLAAVGLGLAGVGSAVGGISAGKAAGKAADVSLRTAQENNALARDIYGQNANTLAPYVNAGTPATGQINALLGLGGDPGGAFEQYRNSTGYQFRLGEGLRALDASASGRSVLQSGAAGKDAIRFGQDFGSGEFGNYLNALGNQQSVGLSGASALAGVGQNYVNTFSQNNNNAGTAQANALLYKGANNPFASTLGMIGGGLFGYGSR